MELIYFKKSCRTRTGSALLGLIVTMVFLSALVAAMIAQTTTGSLGFVNENHSLRAYYLAESGFRYAAAKLKHKASLDNLHKHGSFAIGNNGSFDLKFSTYIFEVTGGIGTSELITEIPFGSATDIFQGSASAENPGYLKVANNPVEEFVNVTVDDPPNDNIVRFTRSAGVWNVFVGEDVRLVVKSNGDPVSQGGDLNLQPDKYNAFPLYNGRFKADGKIYQYKRRESDKLAGITRVDDPTWVAPSLSDGTPIELQAFTRLSSTGSFGSVNRKIVYDIPLSTSDKGEFYDPFDTKDNWEEVSTLGSHDIETIGGDSVLKVSGTDSIGGGNVGSLIKIDSSKVEAILERAHASAGYFLSYDAQVKVGFDPVVPSSYMPGISFRLSADGNYGLSFLKSEDSDGIPDDLCPDYYQDVPLIILWQQTNVPAVQRKWLAYREMTGPVYFSDDFENSLPLWTTTPLTPLLPPLPPSFCNFWHKSSRKPHSGTKSSYYGQELTGDYDCKPSLRNGGRLVSPDIDLSDATKPVLRFWSWFDTEPKLDKDKKSVWVSKDGGSNWDLILEISKNKKKWNRISVDLSSYAGEIIKIGFGFDTVDGAKNNHEGWYIDDVTVAEDFPINEATLMLRVREAATLYFTGGGETPIEDGDIVYQATGRGTVLGTPILASGSWTAGGNATGIILLNKISGFFTDAQPLYVNGASLATTASGPGFYRPRDNYIRVYYGDKDGYGNPGTNPLDYDKRGNPRGGLHWPPDEVEDWSADNDYFTLVQWDKVEDVAVSSLDKIPSLDEPDAILRTNELTTSTGTFAETEIALHTFGNNSTYVYFDDFGLQADLPTQRGFLPAIQE